MASTARAATIPSPAHGDPRLGSGAGPAVDGVVCSAVIGSFLTKAVAEMRGNAVGIELAGHQITGAHPGPTGPIAERDPGSRCTGGGGQHLHPLESFL